MPTFKKITNNHLQKIITKAENTISNIRSFDQLYLKVEDNYFNDTFSEKINIVDNDILLIEDSEDNFSKKKVKISSLNIGGGGNADTLDGLDSSQFLRSDVDDDAYGTIWFNFDGTVNDADVDTNGAIVIGSKTGTNITIDDNEILARDWSGGSHELATLYLQTDGGNVRFFNNISYTVSAELTAFSEKYKIWHAGNDGSGSGLDSDLLDGLHASSFVRSDVNDNIQGTITWSERRGGWGDVNGNTNSPAINFNNSDIININALVFSDSINDETEGLIFSKVQNPTTNSDYSQLAIWEDGELYLTPDISNTTKYKIYHEGNDDNLLKVESDYFNSFTEKSNVHVNDILLIEDSQNSYDKKKITINSLKADIPVIIATNYTLSRTGVYIVDTSSNDITITLPVSGSNSSGYKFIIKNDGTNNVIINCQGSDTIDENSSYTLISNSESITIYDLMNGKFKIV